MSHFGEELLGEWLLESSSSLLDSLELDVGNG